MIVHLYANDVPLMKFNNLENGRQHFIVICRSCKVELESVIEFNNEVHIKLKEPSKDVLPNIEYILALYCEKHKINFNLLMKEILNYKIFQDVSKIGDLLVSISKKFNIVDSKVLIDFCDILDVLFSPPTIFVIK